MDATSCSVVPALPTHLPQILDIYNHYVRHTVVTFHYDEQPLCVIQESYDAVLRQGLPYLVGLLPSSNADEVITQGDRIIGYTYATQLRPRTAYAASVELSLYLHPSYTGQGYGKHLLRALTKQLKQVPKTPAREHGIREVLAIVSIDPNKDVGGFYKSQGFRQAGLLEDVGWKFGRWIHTAYWQLSLGKNEENGP